ncbi:MAG: glycosyltransferase family 4 protein [Candidatus Heimdallarchaeota archaeon]|nr:glycosyltransferase family 4 protein [Candidatus Heimdallarchaeota archaeon]MDH5646919.1 glycosyltransferase family 4 protein [Candidatus Heimdallarchaeota archaeon]
MDIYIISERISPFIGGTETRWHEIGKRLANKGHKITFITGRGDITLKYPKPELYKQNEIIDGYSIKRIYDFKNSNIEAGTRGMMNCINFGIHSGLFIERLKSKIDLDIIDVNIYPHLHLPFYKLFNSSPNVVTWHEVWKNEWRKRSGLLKIGKELEQLNAQIGEHVIGVSKYTLNRLKHIRRKNNNFHLVENGINEKFFKRKIKNKDVPRLLFVGRLTPDKNPHTILLKSFKRLIKTYPTATLDIVGTGPLASIIENKIKTLSNIKYHGELKMNVLLDLFELCNIFVLPSKREGLSIVSREANAVGLPVITINYPTNAAAFETIINGYNGYVSNEKDFTDKIILAFKNIDDLERNSKKEASKYHWDNIIPNLETVYRLAMEK